MDDTGAALEWARSDEARQLGVDAKHIVLAGHSLGGATVLATAAHSSGIEGLVPIDAWNPASTAAKAAQASSDDRVKFRSEFSSYGPSLRLKSKDGVADELLAHGHEWDLAKWAPSVAHVPILSVSAKYANGAENMRLAGSFRQAGNSRVDAIVMDTDHSFTDHRIALESAIVRWLQKLHRSKP